MIATVLTRGDKFMEFCDNMFAGRGSRADLCENTEGVFGIVWVFLELSIYQQTAPYSQGKQKNPPTNEAIRDTRMKG
jgi:predicted secreted acid phosphatase